MVGGIGPAEPLSPAGSARRSSEPSKRRLSRRQSARPRGRPPAGQGPRQAAHRLRGHRRAGRRGRRARAARPRAVERPGGEPSAPSRNEPPPTASSRATRRHVRLLLAENVGPDFYKVNPGDYPTGRGSRVAVDLAVENAACADRRPRPSPTASGFVPPPEDERILRKIRLTSRRLTTVHARRSSTRKAPPRDELAAPPSQGRAARHRPQPARHGARRMQRPRRPTT